MGSTEPLRQTEPPVPILDLAPLHARLRADIDRAMAQVIDANDFVLGEAVTCFEREAASYLGVKHAIGVASGTDALLLALKAANIGRGDEVIVPAFTFFGTIEAILHAHATPVFIDIDPRTLLLDAGQLEALITPRTRAIMPVHLYGATADMPRVASIAEKYQLDVIEDAAQAFGATLQSRFAGSFGLAGCFSFHPAKPLGALGDGGLVVTNHDEVAHTLRRLRDHGATTRHHHTDIGYNSRLDSLQAAVLSVKLRHLDQHLAARNRLADAYGELLAGLPLSPPHVSETGRHSYAQFTIRVDNRDAVRARLADAGISTAVHYPAPAYRQPALSGRFTTSLPVTERASASCLSLPLFEGLADEQQQRVVTTLVKAIRG